MKQVARQIPFEDILSDEQAKRVSASVESIDALKNSIDTIGLLDPLIVEPLSGGKYRLCGGRNRYTAIKALLNEGKGQLSHVPCTVLEFDDHELIDESYKKYKISQIIFDSNDKRSQLTKFEQGRHYASQKQQFPHLFKDDEELARFNNRPVNEVVEAMRLLAIDQAVVDRVERLNLESPNTIPFMCLEAIALAASDKKRSLPVEGQMHVIERLMNPDVNDRLAVMALVTRDKMKKLVDEVRKEYAPDPRGRKPKQETETLETSPSTGDIFSDSTNTLQSAEDPAVHQDDQLNSDRPWKVEKPSDAPTEGVYAESQTKDVGQAEISGAEAAQSPSSVPIISETLSLPHVSAPTLAIVNISINNAINALRKDTPVITDQEYRTLFSLLEDLRLLVEGAMPKVA